MKISAISLPKPVPPKLKPSSKAAKNSEPTKRCLHPRQHLAQHLGARIQATISAQHLDNAGGHRPGLVWRPLRPRARRLRVASRTVIPSATLPIINIQLLPETSARPTPIHSYRPAAATAIQDLRDLLTDSGILRRRIFHQSWRCPAPSLPLRPPQHPGLLHPIRTLLHHNPSESCIPSCRLRTRLPAIRDTSPSVVRLAAGIRRNSLPCVHSILRCYSRQDPNTAGQAVSTRLPCVHNILR